MHLLAKTILSLDTVFQISVPLCRVLDHQPLGFRGSLRLQSPQDDQVAALLLRGTDTLCGLFCK